MTLDFLVFDIFGKIEKEMSAVYIILSIIVAYYVFKFSMRLLLPFAMKKLAERMMKKAQNGQGGFTYTYGGGSPFGQSQPFGGESFKNNSQSNGRSDSQVRVDYVPQREEKGKGTTTAGEFIDFEEIK